MIKNHFLKDIFEYILTLFFPNRCVFCGQIIDPVEHMCADCKKTLPWIDGEICHFCGASKSDCECKKRHGQFYDGIVAPLYYVDKVKHCIHNFKFNDDRLNARALAYLMNKTRKSEYKDIEFDYVAYIPMLENQERKRGYNQGRLLARELSEISGICFGDELLVKLYETKTQHKCAYSIERKGNLLGAFDVNPRYDVNGKNILLVDDVKTSGATLNECSKMLYLNGAESVYCLTAALVNSKMKKDS